MSRHEGCSQSFWQRASLDLFVAGPLLGYDRKVVAADPKSAGVEAAGVPDRAVLELG
jgi:hypothetical protein